MDSGLLFTEPDGSPLRPAEVTEPFVELTRQAWLPPIRLHDLRHGAAHPRSRGRCGHEGGVQRAPALLNHRDHGHLHHGAS